MNNGIKVTLIILVILIVTFGVFMFNDSKSSNLNQSVNEDGVIDESGKISIGNIHYDMPEGYKKGNTNSLGDICITNGSSEIYLSSVDDNNISKYINDYLTYLNEQNQSATGNNLSINNISVISYVHDQVGSTHYWFVYKGNVYTIYTWSYTENCDDIFSDLINSIN